MHFEQVEYIEVCRQHFGPYTLRCSQHEALACNAPSLFKIPVENHPPSVHTVIGRCSESFALPASNCSPSLPANALHHLVDLS